MNELKVSFYKSVKDTTPLESVFFSTIYDWIKSERWKDLVLASRKDKLKKAELPCFTPSGVFKQRNKHSLLEFSHLICFDFDNVEDLIYMNRQIKSLDWIYCSFITPSGKGLKVIVKVASKEEKFELLEKTIADKIFEITGLKRDIKAKGISQAQFISFDPNAYLNDQALYFEECG